MSQMKVLAELDTRPRPGGEFLLEELDRRFVISLVLVHVFLVIVSYLLYVGFVYTDNDIFWVMGVSALFPLYAMSVYQIVSCKRWKQASLEHAIRLHRDGVACVGSVNMISVYRFGDYDNYFLKSINRFMQFFSMLRIDYDFVVKDKVYVGSCFVDYKFGCSLYLNQPIVVIYDEKNHLDNMLHPVPMKSWGRLFR